MRVLISGGGTGGHIYPALSIIENIRNNVKDSEILYVGTKKGLESDIVPKEGFNFETIRIEGFSRKLSFDTIKSTAKMIQGFSDAGKIIRRFKPDIVIGTGGYVCGPVVMYASMANIPTLIHEQNAFPGVTNKILSRMTTSVACSFEEAKQYFKEKDRVVVTGNPVRKEILEMDMEESRRDLNIGDGQRLILSFGGSGGQRSLNETMLKYISELKDRDIRIVHVTGKRFYNQFMEESENYKSIKNNKNIEIQEYSYNLPKYLSASDLIITSAGAITISEITALGKPSIIIPKSNTAENHQVYNGKALEKAGAGIMILEKDLEKIDLIEKINSIIYNDEVLNTMEKNSKKMGLRDANDRIFDVIEDII